MSMRLRQQDRAGIQPLFHLHQADAGAIVAGFDRALDRRRAAPARQQRGVHVPAAMHRDVEHRLRQQQAIGHHHHQVRLQRAQLGLRGGAAEILGLVDRDAALHGFQLDRRRLQAAAATGWPVRLGVGGHDLAMARAGAQAGHGEFRRAGEDDPQARFSKRGRRRGDRFAGDRRSGAGQAARRALASFLRTISRFSGLR
jgi:hypothetical protein